MSTLGIQPWKAMHGGTHSCIFQNFSGADFLKNLAPQQPKPFNNFSEIGCAPLVLFNISVLLALTRNNLLNQMNGDIN